MRRMRIFQPGRYLSVDFGKKEVMAIRLHRPAEGGTPTPEITKSGFSDQDQLEMELSDFLDHVRNRTQPAVSGRAGRRALDVALRVVSQINENRQRIEQLLAANGSSDPLATPPDNA